VNAPPLSTAATALADDTPRLAFAEWLQVNNQPSSPRSSAFRWNSPDSADGRTRKPDPNREHPQRSTLHNTQQKNNHNYAVRMPL